MKKFTKDYYVHNGELYKKLKPNANGCYHLTNQSGKRQWISIKTIEKLIEEAKQNAKGNDLQNRG